MNYLKTLIFAVCSVMATFVATVDDKLLCLFGLMVIDWMIGGIILPFVFKKSPKTESGGASSYIGFIGLCKKACMLLAVGAGFVIDKMAGLNMIYYGLIIAFSCNELLSIFESLGLIGLPMPDAVKNAIDVLSNMNNDRGGAHE